MFRKLLMAAIILFVTIAVKADDQKIESKVQKVTVFLNGAQVTRMAMVNVNMGTSTLVFQNISPGIDVQSIQVRANGDFTILAVNQEMDYLNDQVKQKRVEELKAQQKVLQDKITLKSSFLAIYQQEASMLIKNQVITGQNANLDIIKLKQALDFQTERLTDLKKKEQAINDEVELLGIELKKYDQQLADIGKNSSTATSNILVTVSSNKTLQSQFTLSYLVHNASWFPTYDIRAKNVNSPVSISYKANVTQQSGEDWKNIKLTLSTGNPSINSIKPELSPYYLNTAQISSGNSLNDVVVIGYGTKYKDESDEVDKALQGRAAGVLASTTPVSVNQAVNQNVAFNIDNPYSVPSDGKQYLVEINQFDVNATYQYAVVPKLSTDVFLTAKLTDWNKFNMLSGQVNLYYEGTFIGRSVLNTNLTADTLGVSLGVDKNIVVTRTSLKDLTEKQSLGSNKKETRDWQIEVKNRKDQPVNLLVEDQLPVSQNSAIDVETQETSGGELDKLTGKILWKFPLKPQGDKKIELKYQVKYPKNQSIAVL